MLTHLSTFDKHRSAMVSQNPKNPSGNLADLDTNLTSADQIMLCLDSKASKYSLLFQSCKKEANEYLATVDGLRNFTENLVTDSSSAKVMRTKCLMEVWMNRLKTEFHRILSTNVEPTMAPDDGNSSDASSEDEWTDEDGSSDGCHLCRNSNADDICEIDMMPPDAVLDLHSIAKRMVAAGYGSECVRIYGQTRKSVIEGCLNRIGIEWLYTSDVQKMEWGLLDIKIKKWIRTVRIAVRILFASEKRLCDEIFAGLHKVRDSCFAEVVKGPTRKLLAFGESVAKRKRSGERLFRVLDMYKALSDLMPDFDIVYCQKSCASVRTQFSTIVLRLGQSAWEILTELANAIQVDYSNTPVAGGAIHPLTRYVMNYLRCVSEYKESLMSIIANSPFHVPKAMPRGLKGLFGDLNRPASDLSMKLGWIIITLQCKLDFKASLYEDVSLSYLFLMNNLHYIVKKVKGSKLLGLLGYGWLRKNQNKVRHYAENYEQVAWMKVLNCLMDEGIHVSLCISSGVSLQALKDRLKRFNFVFEEVLTNHSGWMVPDAQLREEIMISIAAKIIPAYRSFLGRLRKHLVFRRHSDMYIKYTAEDLEAHLLNLFHGNPSSLSSRKFKKEGRSIFLWNIDDMPL